jgi:catechol 2,3-dioxygenase-like lactoylglutathione lyase family enzyme
MSIADGSKDRLARERGVVKPQKLAHVVRRTSRFDELVDWYCTVLGAEVVHPTACSRFLTYDDEHHRIAIATIPGSRNSRHGGGHRPHRVHVRRSRRPASDTYRRLKAEGIEPSGASTTGRRVLDVLQGSGRQRVELPVDTMPSAERSTPGCGAATSPRTRSASSSTRRI